MCMKWKRYSCSMSSRQFHLPVIITCRSVCFFVYTVGHRCGLCSDVRNLCCSQAPVFVSVIVCVNSIEFISQYSCGTGCLLQYYMWCWCYYCSTVQCVQVSTEYSVVCALMRNGCSRRNASAIDEQPTNC